MSNTKITVGMVGTVPVGRNQVKVEVLAINSDTLTVKNLNTQKESEVKVARFTPETAVIAPATGKAKDSTVKAVKAVGSPKERKPSLLDNAYAILKARNEAMGSKEIIEALKLAGTLTSNGKTPEQTLFSALYRDIQKGDSRFEKAGKGKFKAK